MLIFIVADCLNKDNKVFGDELIFFRAFEGALM
jgi:hypothetical protein